MKGEHTNLMPVYIPSNHFDYRAKNRLNIDITQEIAEEITLRVRNGLYKSCEKSKRTKNVYKYNIYVSGRLRELTHCNCDTISVIIDKNDWQLITVYKTY